MRMLAFAALAVTVSAAASAADINVALITGGHKFDEPAFEAMFEALPDIKYTRMHHVEDAAWLDDIETWSYDVIVLYNMSQEITERQRKNFITLLERGVGLFVLHHAMVAYQTWPEFEQIAGCKYVSKTLHAGGAPWPKSTFKHDVEQHITVVDKAHPITKGFADFDILDETYGGVWFDEKNHVLLRSDAETSDGPVAYTRAYAAARVCLVQLGHDAKAYNDPDFQRLLAQAIHWVAAAD